MEVTNKIALVFGVTLLAGAVLGAQSQGPAPLTVGRYAEAWAGGEEAAGGASDHGGFQLTCGGAGGCWIDEVWMSDAGTSTGWRIHTSLAGTDPLTSDALGGTAPTKMELRATATTSTVAKGTTTVDLDDETPTFSGGVIAGTAAGWPLHPFYLPNGALLSVVGRTDNIVTSWAIRWREVL